MTNETTPMYAKRGLFAAVLFLAMFVATAPALAAKFKFEPKAKSWYLQTIAVTDDGHFDDRSGVIGRIPGGQDGKDLHDIPAFASVNGAPVAIIMVRGEEWGDHAGEYLSDYRAPGQGRASWDFVVTSNNPDAEITLGWEGLYTISQNAKGGFETTLSNRNKVLNDLYLVDVDNGTVVGQGIMDDGHIVPYTFAMNGASERHFRWVAGKPRKKDLAYDQVVTLESVSPRQANERLTAREQSPATGNSKSKAAGFGAPPSLGTLPGEGVRQSNRLDSPVIQLEIESEPSP
ncbi:hypothetical protein F3N42_01425 [Marinihelvus fidelis]|uniref:Uncharacterized protein n=1 Tax=Marinihelvus fidelis TaxID=2613842 RepID=A0A5N0TIE7_9GAMM|nr:hypothetical protein [Marinihelvus fidelis]KAA9133049.1 hypothetical protein F3N42_01425 [Marinihelvus fidelis]